MLRSPEEFREVMDRAFTMMSTDPEMGPALHDADTPQRFEFPDLDLVVNIHNAAEPGPDGPYLAWEWSDDVDWEPDVKMSMDSEVANGYFQGQVNVPMAIARRRIKASGNIKKALEIIPITKPVFAQYRAMIEADYPHLVAG
jgi:SCP-2 sterol transfer family